MRIRNFKNTYTNLKSLNTLKIQGREFHKNPQIAKDIIGVINRNKCITDFSKTWKPSITIKSSSAQYKIDGYKPITVKLAIKFNDYISQNSNLINKLKKFIYPRKVIILQDEGKNIEQASRNLEMKLWSNDLGPIICEAERIANSDAHFRERYFKIFGIYFKRKPKSL